MTFDQGVRQKSNVAGLVSGNPDDSIYNDMTCLDGTVITGWQSYYPFNPIVQPIQLEQWTDCLIADPSNL